MMGSGMSQVLPGLFVGSFRSSRDRDLLRKNEISHIVSVHDNARALEKDIEYLCVVASDKPEQPLAPEIPRVNNFIHNARLNGGVVLVHCLAGISRSVTLTTAYVMSISGLGWKDALNVVRGARRQANPNLGFKLQLKEFEAEGAAEERAKLAALYSERTDKISQSKDVEECGVLLSRFDRWIHFGDKLEIEGEWALVERMVESRGGGGCHARKSHSADDILKKKGAEEDLDSKEEEDEPTCSKISCQESLP